MEPTPSMTTCTRAERAAAEDDARGRRRALAHELSEPHDGVVTRQMLIGAGITRGQLDGEVRRGAWHAAGVHTLCITGTEPVGRALWWRALWESGKNAVLDGPTALLAAGLTGWKESLIHVSLPNGDRVRPVEGVRHHRLRDLGDVTGAGLLRTKPEVAVVRAAQWAVSDRAAATLVAMTVQQRLVRPEQVIARWESVKYSQRREVLTGVIGDVCNGAHSLGELDFARMCRQRGLPEPTRQALRPGAKGRVYLDVYWEALEVHVEIQGVHHVQGTATIEDALRFNALGLRNKRLLSLQIPVLGLRVCPDVFMDQVAAALASKMPRPGAA